MAMLTAPDGATKKNIELGVRIAHDMWEVARAAMLDGMDSYKETSRDFKQFQSVPAIASITLAKMFIDSMAAACRDKSRQEVAIAWAIDLFEHLELTEAGYQIDKATILAARDKREGKK